MPGTPSPDLESLTGSSSPLQLPPRPSIRPEQIETSWRRFSSGLWGIPPGDISEAYSAETFPKVKTFREGARLYTTCMMAHTRFFRCRASCHPLIPADDYQGPEPAERGYEGRLITFNRTPFRLGPPVHFVSFEPTLEESRHLLRVLYTEGGWFARHDTYGQFLESLEEPSGNETLARQHELTGELALLSKSGLKDWMEKQGLPPAPAQLNLGF